MSRCLSIVSIAYENSGCLCGRPHDAFKYLKEHDGLASGRSYPYTGVSTGETCLASTMPKVASMASYTMINNEQSLLNAVATVGTVVVAINNASQELTNYKSGILDVPDCGNSPAEWFLVVGYGAENGVDFWSLQSSRGVGWGEQGYLRLVRGKNMCGVADWASYAVAK
ncbi:unnamed protein product [Medioppia subpectinata]|uniref:Peptidase C1A papain C-terminal domain-containing protein n=1 Tax=Medioppia subpectinata TaxID=1979941 RepID=A0A7R9Q469_9ACAR|nr:unnamed protein product [Medioppia subpectinata]CAG2111227.1 unnamed protein product [Medioppia subpectinata]